MCVPQTSSQPLFTRQAAQGRNKTGIIGVNERHSTKSIHTEGAMIGREDSMETGIVVVFVFAGGLMPFYQACERPAGGSETFCLDCRGF